MLDSFIQEFNILMQPIQETFELLIRQKILHSLSVEGASFVSLRPSESFICSDVTYSMPCFGKPSYSRSFFYIKFWDIWFQIQQRCAIHYIHIRNVNYAAFKPHEPNYRYAYGIWTRRRPSSKDAM